MAGGGLYAFLRSIYASCYANHRGTKPIFYLLDPELCPGGSDFQPYVPGFPFLPIHYVGRARPAFWHRAPHSEGLLLLDLNLGVSGTPLADALLGLDARPPSHDHLLTLVRDLTRRLAPGRRRNRFWALPRAWLQRLRRAGLRLSGSHVCLLDKDGARPAPCQTATEHGLSPTALAASWSRVQEKASCQTKKGPECSLHPPT